MPTPQHLARLGCSFWGSGESPLLRWQCSRTAVSWHNRHSADFKTIIRCSPLQVCTEFASSVPSRDPTAAPCGDEPGPHPGDPQREAAAPGPARPPAEGSGGQRRSGAGSAATERDRAALIAPRRQLLEAGLLLKSCFQISAERRTLAITRPA